MNAHSQPTQGTAPINTHQPGLSRSCYRLTCTASTGQMAATGTNTPRQLALPSSTSTVAKTNHSTNVQANIPAQ